MNFVLWFFLALVPLILSFVAPAADLHNTNGVLIQMTPNFNLYLPLAISIAAFIILLGIVILPGDRTTPFLRRVLRAFLIFGFFLIFFIGFTALLGKLTANSSLPLLASNAIKINSVLNPFVNGIFLIAIVWDYSKKK